MEGFLNFLVDHYVLFLTISILLVFALIGYFVDVNRRKNNVYKINKPEEINLESLEVQENVALSDALNKNKNVGLGNDPINMTTADTVEQLDGNQNITQ